MGRWISEINDKDEKLLLKDNELNEEKIKVKSLTTKLKDVTNDNEILRSKFEEKEAQSLKKIKALSTSESKNTYLREERGRLYDQVLFQSNEVQTAKNEAAKFSGEYKKNLYLAEDLHFEKQKTLELSRRQVSCVLLGNLLG